MVCTWNMGVQANFQRFVIVGFDAETRYKAVDHQVNVVDDTVLSTRKWFGRIKEQSLENVTNTSTSCLVDGISNYSILECPNRIKFMSKLRKTIKKMPTFSSMSKTEWDPIWVVFQYHT